MQKNKQCMWRCFVTVSLLRQALSGARSGRRRVTYLPAVTGFSCGIAHGDLLRGDGTLILDTCVGEAPWLHAEQLRQLVDGLGRPA